MAPDLINVEVVSVLRRHVLARTMGTARAASLLADPLDAPIRRVPTLPLIESVWTSRDNLTAYDAAYVALAAERDVPLITTDSKRAASPPLAATVIGVR